MLGAAGIDASLIPVFNYLGFYEDNAKDSEISNEVKVNETLSRVVNVFCRNDDIYIEAFCKEGQQNELK